MGTELDYCGSELDVFIHATNWKKYWADTISPYIGDRVLDVGAGIGATAKALNVKKFQRWVELEPDKNQASRIKKMQDDGEIPAHYEIKNGSSNDIGEETTFDTILYIDVLEHIEDDAGELMNVSKCLVEGGHIIIVSPAHNYLFTEFDKQIGHFRRYSASDLIQIKPKDFEIVKLCYLDSVGMLASLANRLILKSGSPNIRQIKFWDGFMVPASRWLDRVFMHKLGKSVVCVLKKTRPLQ